MSSEINSSGIQPSSHETPASNSFSETKHKKEEERIEQAAASIFKESAQEQGPSKEIHATVAPREQQKIQLVSFPAAIEIPTSYRPEEIVPAPSNEPESSEPFNTNSDQAFFSQGYGFSLTQSSSVLQDGGINLNQSTFPFDRTSVQQKALELHQLMPGVKDKNQLILMAAFIEENREALTKLAREAPEGIYIRREASGLPLSLLVTPEGRFFWETKRKARSELPMGGFFKKLYKCVEHDEVKFYISGAMTLPTGNTTMEEMKRQAAHREVEISKNLKGLPHVVHVMHTMRYTAKPSTVPAGYEPRSKIKVITEYFPNRDIAHALQTKKFSKSEKEQIIQAVLEGLSAMHDEGWIHGDMKSANIFLDEQFLPHIGDFGSVHRESEIPFAPDYNWVHPSFNDYYQFVKKDKDTTDIIRKEGALERKIEERLDMFAFGLALVQIELNQPDLFRTGLFKGYKDASGLASLYSSFPENTAIQKFIKRLINPDLNAVPTAAEAQAIWNTLKKSP